MQTGSADPSRALFLAGCQAHGLPQPQIEVKFARELGRKWRFDYLFAGWLAVEKDGGLTGRGPACPACGRKRPGAHSSIKQMKSDREKDRAAVLLGYCTLRYTPEEIASGAAFAEIKTILETRRQR